MWDAGQAVVQFATAQDNQGGVSLVIKFFATIEEYEVEATLYARTPELVQCMPEVLKMVHNKEGSVKDPFGNKMPPYIAMERGDSLTNLIHSHRRLDMVTAGKVCFCCLMRARML